MEALDGSPSEEGDERSSRPGSGATESSWSASSSSVRYVLFGFLTLRGSTADKVHSSVFGGFVWYFTHFYDVSCEPGDFYGCGYFYVRLYWNGFVFQANTVEITVRCSSSSV